MAVTWSCNRNPVRELSSKPKRKSPRQTEWPQKVGSGLISAQVGARRPGDGEHSCEGRRCAEFLLTTADGSGFS